MLDELGRVTRCGRRAPASGVAAHSHIAQFCSFPPRPSYHVSSPPGRPRAPPRRSLSRSTPSRLRFASHVSRHHHASTPSSSTTNSHANSHANSNSPQPSRYQKALDDTKAAVTLHPATPTPPPHQALSRSPASRQHHTKEKTTSPLSPTACHRTGILYRSAGRDR